MTRGVSIEYAHARVSARLGERPDERVWQQLRAGRRLTALLETVRASPAAPYVGGIDPRAPVHGLELAFRQQFRLRVDELAEWAPDEWVEAVRWVRPLVDLPALAYLAGGAPPLPWMHTDPELAGWLQPTVLERRAALAASPLAPLADALHDPASAAPRSDGRTRLHGVLTAWSRHWRTLWPRCAHDDCAGLERLLALVQRHLLDFPVLSAGDAEAARRDLDDRVTALMRRSAARPVALFAWLALVGLDLERLRSLFTPRALADAGAL